MTIIGQDLPQLTEIKKNVTIIDKEFEKNKCHQIIDMTIDLRIFGVNNWPDNCLDFTTCIVPMPCHARWHVTGDTGHMTLEKLHMTHDLKKIFGY